MFDPVTITSNVVATGSLAVCGVGVGSRACVPTTENRTTVMIASGAQPSWLWGRRAACLPRKTVNQARRPVAPQARKPVLHRRLLTRLLPFVLMLEAGGRIRRRAGLVLGAKER